MKNSLFKSIVRRKRFQPFWEKIHSYSIVAMNYWGGGHFEESGELWVIRNMIKGSDITVFDVGANRGLYTKYLLAALPGSATVYCFEPSEKTFAIAKQNLESLPNVKLLNFGLSDKNETLDLHRSEESDGLSSIYKDNPLTEFSSHETIELKVLSEFCNENEIETIDFLKIDVEGHELNVLTGARKMISEGRVKIIQFEMGECNIASRTFFRDFYDLLSPTHEIFRIVPNGLAKIEKYKTINEVFACVNYLAVLKGVRAPS